METSDGQTSENQTGSVACGVCSSFTAGCMVVWDFSTALDMAHIVKSTALFKGM